MCRTKVVLLVFVSTLYLLTGCASDEDKKKSHLEKGNSYFTNQEYRSARIEYKNAIQIDPAYVEAYLKLGETNLKLGDPRGALQAYSMVAELDPDDMEAQFKLATFYLLGKRDKEAKFREKKGTEQKEIWLTDYLRFAGRSTLNNRISP